MQEVYGKFMSLSLWNVF